MIRRSLILLVVLVGLAALLAPSAVEPAQAWGFFGHKRINRMACFTLPPEMFPFYKRHIDFITDHAVDPDRRRYAVPEEAPRHYIDIDHYQRPGEDPFSVVPRKWNDAVAKYTEDTLQAYGIVPWHIQVVYARLIRAFQRGDVDRILTNSADLGHYVADAHVPLHTTENYNGQMTNQYGIHAFWESRIPELSADNYDHLVGRVTYLDDPLATAWQAIQDSHAEVDSVLGIEKRLSQEFPEDQKYIFEQSGRTGLRTYSRDYTKAYEDAMMGMVERRMNASIATLGDFWYSAWVNAGQPDLDRFEQADVSDSLKRVLAAEQELWEQNSKGYGREHE
ncbi:MAG TPA: zinc dependent phospholipase C family protein [Flavobacteriales bacterium]|nr:zinc dependent phospholipase C family protein [Flavobacteriales bacterium]